MQDFYCDLDPTIFSDEKYLQVSKFHEMIYKNNKLFESLTYNLHKIKCIFGEPDQYGKCLEFSIKNLNSIIAEKTGIKGIDLNKENWNLKIEDGEIAIKMSDIYDCYMELNDKLQSILKKANKKA